MKYQLLIWRVVYNITFRSSSGMEPYEQEENNHSGIVWTFGRSLDDVEKAISDSLDGQSRLTRLVSAEYIGTAINPLVIQTRYEQG